ncbi:MAG: hypothetical protein QNJ63_06085 [Calothrix sp. MO_192.B10]|nr:hypothetical protein [Calothrix sp. MO_192.B10]
MWLAIGGGLEAPTINASCLIHESRVIRIITRRLTMLFSQAIADIMHLQS